MEPRKLLFIRFTNNFNKLRVKFILRLFLILGFPILTNASDFNAMLKTFPQFFFYFDTEEMSQLRGVCKSWKKCIERINPIILPLVKINKKISNPNMPFSFTYPRELTILIKGRDDTKCTDKMTFFGATVDRKIWVLKIYEKNKKCYFSLRFFTKDNYSRIFRKSEYVYQELSLEKAIMLEEKMKNNFVNKKMVVPFLQSIIKTMNDHILHEQREERFGKLLDDFSQMVERIANNFYYGAK